MYDAHKLVLWVPTVDHRDIFDGAGVVVAHPRSKILLLSMGFLVLADSAMITQNNRCFNG